MPRRKRLRWRAAVRADQDRRRDLREGRVILRPIRSVGDVKRVDLAWDRLHEQAADLREKRIKEYGAPDLKWVSCQDIVLVYRLPSKEKEKMHKGLIHIPDSAQTNQTPF